MAVDISRRTNIASVFDDAMAWNRLRTRLSNFRSTLSFFGMVRQFSTGMPRKVYRCAPNCLVEVTAVR